MSVEDDYCCISRKHQPAEGVLEPLEVDRRHDRTEEAIAAVAHRIRHRDILEAGESFRDQLTDHEAVAGRDLLEPAAVCEGDLPSGRGTCDRGDQTPSLVHHDQVHEVGELRFESFDKGDEPPSILGNCIRGLGKRHQDLFSCGDEFVGNGRARGGEAKGFKLDLAPLRL